MKDESFPEFVEDQLQRLDGVSFRSMFGGYGLYQRDVFFGIIYRGRLYFRTNAESCTAYKERGMKPFRPNPKAKQTLHSYYEVPVEILEDRDSLVTWARTAAATRTSRPASTKQRTGTKSKRGMNATR